MEIKKILKLKMIKKLPFNNKDLINKKILKISINFHNIYSVSLIQNKDI